MEERKLIMDLIEKIEEIIKDKTEPILDNSEFSENKQRFLKKYGHI